MRQFNVLFRWGWTFLVVVSLGLAGCDGDDGAAGAAGTAGLPGDDGVACWDLDGDGVEDPEEDINGDGVWDAADCSGTAAKVTPLESCGVCHDDASFAAAKAAHAKVTEPGVVDVGSFAGFIVAEDAVVPGDLVISFSVTADGAAATDATFYRAYVSDGIRRTTLTGRFTDDPGDPLAVPPIPPTPASAFFVNEGGGNYSVTIEGGFTEFGATNSRYLIIVRTGANDLEIAAVGDFPDAIPLAGLANSAACVGCHGASGEGNGLAGRFNPVFRGGHYSAPISANQCVVCHRPDDPATPGVDEEPGYGQFVKVIHGVHNSHQAEGNDFLDDYDVTYPTYMSNCSVCHSDSNIVPATGGSALAAANAMPVSGEGCFTCHGSMASWDFLVTLPDGSTVNYSSLHLGIPNPETADCSVCHNPAGAASTKVVVADFHNYAGEDANGDPIGIVTQRGGQIVDGVDTSLTEGAKFVWEITGVDVVDNGTNMAISWQASYDGNPVEPCNLTVGVGAPVFHLGENAEELSMYRSYAQGDDFIIGTSTSGPGQPGSEDLTEANTNCDADPFVAVTTLAVDDDDAVVDAVKGRLALGGKPLVLSVGDPAATMEARVPTPTYDYFVDDGAAALMRRNVVDTSRCLQCHVGSLYQHGGDRVDNVDMCLVCHNSASNEKYRRVAMGVDETEAYDGKTGETFEMKTMLHRIHSAATDGSPPYVIYRSRGIYAFAPDVSDVPNWDVISTEGCDATEIARGERLVFGGDPNSTTSCQPHNFHSATYPRAFNACTACHTDDFKFIPDQTEAMATTTEAGSSDWPNQLDDTLQGAATTACVTCHKDGASKGHAYQNSWVPQVFPEGRQTIIDAVN